MRSLNALNSIDNNENITWDNRVYSLITEMRSSGIASNELWSFAMQSKVDHKTSEGKNDT